MTAVDHRPQGRTSHLDAVMQHHRHHNITEVRVRYVKTCEIHGRARRHNAVSKELATGSRHISHALAIREDVQCTRSAHCQHLAGAICQRCANVGPTRPQPRLGEPAECSDGCHGGAPKMRSARACTAARQRSQSRCSDPTRMHGRGRRHNVGTRQNRPRCRGRRALVRSLLPRIGREGDEARVES